MFTKPLVLQLMLSRRCGYFCTSPSTALVMDTHKQTVDTFIRCQCSVAIVLRRIIQKFKRNFTSHYHFMSVRSTSMPQWEHNVSPAYESTCPPNLKTSLQQCHVHYACSISIKICLTKKNAWIYSFPSVFSLMEIDLLENKDTTYTRNLSVVLANHQFH